MSRLREELRHALRRLARWPSFSWTALLTLALGIGASTGLFAVVYGVLLRPLPWAEADRCEASRPDRALAQWTERPFP